jgi:tetratricopeptide (TPR) repeat protein
VELDGDLDPMEAAWFEGDPQRLEASARRALSTNPRDAHALGWLGLAQYVTGRVAAAQASLKQAFALLREQQAAAADDDARHQHTWAMHTIANHLIDALADNPTLGVPAAKFVVEVLALDHVPALRVLAEDRAGAGGDAVGASKLLKRALALDPMDPETHYLVARLAARVGQKPTALKHLGKAIEYGAGMTQARTLARYEPDFDGLKGDAEFQALIEVLPADPLLRPLYEALDRGEPWRVLELAPEAVKQAARPLDVLYPWREALELSLESGAGDTAQLEKDLATVQARIEALEDEGATSDAYLRFCGDA